MMRCLIPGILMLTLLFSTSGLAQSPYSRTARLQFLAETFEAGAFETSLMEGRLLRAEHPLWAPDTVTFFIGRNLLMLEAHLPASEELRGFDSEDPEMTRFAQAAEAYLDFSQTGAIQDPALLPGLKQEGDLFRDYGILLDQAMHCMTLDTGTYKSLREIEKPKDLYVRLALQKIDAEVAHFGEQKMKKPGTAGVLSAIIPGAGKCYLGKWGTGIMSFVGMGALGVQAWEGYRKGGPKHPQFIGFAGLFGLIYAANIYGSVTQAKALNLQIVSDFKNGVALQVDISFDRLFAP